MATADYRMMIIWYVFHMSNQWKNSNYKLATYRNFAYRMASGRDIPCDNVDNHPISGIYSQGQLFKHQMVYLIRFFSTRIQLYQRLDMLLYTINLHIVIFVRVERHVPVSVPNRKLIQSISVCIV